jgi:hypothetical protein
MSNQSFGYPRELFHPNGFKTCTVYSPDEHRAVNEQFDAWRESHMANTAAALKGEPAPSDAKARKTGKTGDEQ